MSGGAARPPAPRWFLWSLVALTALGLGIRLTNVLVWRPTCDEDLIAVARDGRLEELSPPPADCFAVRGDALYAYYQAYWNGHGHLYVDGADFFFDRGDLSQPGAQDLPLYGAVLGLVAATGADSPTALRVASSLLGATVVVFCGLVGRRVAGARAGVVAAALAAVHPLLWINDGMLMTEALYAPLVAATVLAAYAFWDRPRLGSAAVLGACTGLAALTRGEAILGVGLIGLPLLWGLRRRDELSWGRAAALLATTGGVALVLLAPWVGWNLVRFEHPVTLTSGTGAVLSAGSCDVEFEGPFLGFWGNCYDLHIAEGLTEAPPPGRDADESELDLLKRRGATAYLADHLDRLPVVVAARVGRMWDLYRPDQMATLNATLEGRGRWPSDAGVRLHLGLLLPAGVAGTVVLWRRRVPISPFVAQAVAVTITAAVSFGLTRYRVPVDVALVVLSGVALDALVRGRWPLADGGSVQPRPRSGSRSGSQPGSGPIPVAAEVGA